MVLVGRAVDRGDDVPQGEGALVRACGLEIARCRSGGTRGGDRRTQGQRDLARGRRMDGECRSSTRAGRALRGRPSRECFGVRAMEAAPLRGEELILDRLAEQGVAEHVRVAVGSRGDEEVGGNRFLECGGQPLVVHGEDRSEKGVVDRTAGDRRGGEQPACLVRQRTDATQQDVA